MSETKSISQQPMNLYASRSMAYRTKLRAARAKSHAAEALAILKAARLGDSDTTEPMSVPADLLRRCR